MWVSRIGVIVWALFMGVIMSVAQFANINVNWLVLIIGGWEGLNPYAALQRTR